MTKDFSRGELEVRGAISGLESLTLKGRKGAVLSVAFSLDGKRIASAVGGALKVWDASKDAAKFMDAARQKAAGLASGKKATASNVFQGDAQYDADKAFDGYSETRWATDTGTQSAWLEVDPR